MQAEPTNYLASAVDAYADVPDSSEQAVDTSTTAELESTIGVELNFNAYADHVPPTTHAKRVAKMSDPSLQDFADQALELATLHAELKRLSREYDSAQHAIRQRDHWLQKLRDEIAVARTQAREATRELSEAKALLA